MANSPTASPADSLIHATQPHKRARSAAWSYFFYPEEQWVELVITLPFAILLKHVQIRPHNGMLTSESSVVTNDVFVILRTIAIIIRLYLCNVLFFKLVLFSKCVTEYFFLKVCMMIIYPYFLYFINLLFKQFHTLFSWRYIFVSISFCFLILSS